MNSLIQSLPTEVFIMIFLIPVAMAGLALFVGLHSRRFAKIAAATALTRLGSAKAGYVAITGKVEAIGHQMLKAPLTDSACCWYKIKVEEWKRSLSSSEDKSQWSTIEEFSSCEPFLISDGSASAAVAPDGADIFATDRSIWYGANPLPDDKNPPRVKLSESAEGMLRVSGTKNTKFRYTEERIYSGDPIFALAEYSPEPVLDDDGVEFLFDIYEDQGQANRIVKAESQLKSLVEKLAQITSKRLLKPDSKKTPFILASGSREEFLNMHTTGSKASFMLAGGFLAVAIFVLYLRFN